MHSLRQFPCAYSALAGIPNDSGKSHKIDFAEAVVIINGNADTHIFHRVSYHRLVLLAGSPCRSVFRKTAGLRYRQFHRQRVPFY